MVYVPACHHNFVSMMIHSANKKQTKKRINITIVQIGYSSAIMEPV